MILWQVIHFSSVLFTPGFSQVISFGGDLENRLNGFMQPVFTRTWLKPGVNEINTSFGIGGGIESEGKRIETTLAL